MDIGQQDRHAFIVMELLEGMTLKHRIAGKPVGDGGAPESGNRDFRRT